MEGSGDHGSLWEQARAFEQRLTRSAARAPLHSRDPELARLLAFVSERRMARLGAVRGRAAPSQAPAPAPAAAPAASAEPGTLLESRRVTDDVRILRVARPAGFDFTPGQHVKLGVPGGGQNSYTIASAPSDPALEFCIEQVPGGRVSPRLLSLSPGARLALGAAAKGNFGLVARARLHLMVATVTGIAPFVSMLRDAAARDAWPGRFVVLHGASFADELAYRDELTQLAQREPGRVRYLASVSRPADLRNRGFRGPTGRVTELILPLARELQEQAAGVPIQAYACGHPEMVATVSRTLAALGLPVATEAFD